MYYNKTTTTKHFLKDNIKGNFTETYDNIKINVQPLVVVRAGACDVIDNSWQFRGKKKAF